MSNLTTNEKVANQTYCVQCGMPCAPNEYHPFAACLMFIACHDVQTVKANLHAVWVDGHKSAMDDKERT